MSEQDEDWKLGSSIVKFTLPLLIVLVPIGFYARGAGLLSDKTFAPMEEQVRHDTFKQSQAYNDSMAADLEDMWMAYKAKDTTGDRKAVIRSVALHRVAAHPVESLPTHLRTWIQSLKEQP